MGPSPYPNWSFPEGLELVDDPSPARWVEDSVAKYPWATVGDLVPDSFEAYVRILHPAYRGHGPDLQPITWAEVAEIAGTQLHAHADFGRLAGLGTDLNARPAWGQRPPEGSLPTEVAVPLVDTLRHNTTTPDECWFCVWSGWGTLFALEGYDEDTYRHVKTPGREYLLLRGAIDMVDAAGRDQVSGPSIWWPDDHAWCVATEIDLDSTFVGASADCSAAIVADPRLETVPAELVDRVDGAADTINPV